uniref:Uncharacterized protein n=1 Tax=Anguilla anguilla TaxID=7936 RepID=A0A0E9W3Q6_ANGAN
MEWGEGGEWVTSQPTGKMETAFWEAQQFHPRPKTQVYERPGGHRCS